MAYQAQGVVHKIFDTEKKSETFQTREFILELRESQYPQMIKFQLTQDKCSIVDDCSVGDEIVVHFDLRGREWNDRFFTNLQCWKIESGSAANSASPQHENQSYSEKNTSETPPANKQQNTFDDEDIPF